MNQCLEYPPVDETSSAPDALPPGAEVEALVPATGGGDAPAPAPVEKGRVLLLEDDPAFKEVIRDFLIESGYSVVAVANGGEGVREVLASDFALILCDLMMPTLPGDMFYRAVERIRPGLCDRFVFMTGYRGDAKTNAFLRSVNGTVLRKPFHLKDLLDTITFTEARSGLRKAFEAAKAEDVPAPAAEPPAAPPPPPAPVRPPPAEVAVAVPVPRPRVPAEPPPPLVVPALVIRAPEPELEVVSRTFPMAVGALVLVCGLVFGLRYLEASNQAEEAAAERGKVEAEWREFGPQLAAAENARRSADALLQRAKRLADERRAARWTEALRAVSTTAGAGIDLRGVATREVRESPGTCEITITGGAIGRAPREAADEFHRTVRGELERRFSGGVATRLEKLEDEPESAAAAPGEPRRASFVISLTLTTEGVLKPERVVEK